MQSSSNATAASEKINVTRAKSGPALVVVSLEPTGRCRERGAPSCELDRELWLRHRLETRPQTAPEPLSQRVHSPRPRTPVEDNPQLHPGSSPATRMTSSESNFGSGGQQCESRRKRASVSMRVRRMRLFAKPLHDVLDQLDRSTYQSRTELRNTTRNGEC
jgi:hypothetical protein